MSRPFHRRARHTRAAALVAALASVGAGLTIMLAAGCQHATEPLGSLFPAFALRDVNPHSRSSGAVVTRDSLTGPASVVYFGWAT